MGLHPEIQELINQFKNQMALDTRNANNHMDFYLDSKLKPVHEKLDKILSVIIPEKSETKTKSK